MKCASAVSWKTEYDPILNQVYYLNQDDGSISFDLPCEVHNMPKRSSSTGLFSRLSSKLSLKRSKSANSPSTCAMFKVGSTKLSGTFKSTGSESSSSMPTSPIESASVSRRQSFTAEPFSVASVPRNAYWMEKSFNLDGADDLSLIESEESIRSFHHELPRSDIYYDIESSIYVDLLLMPHLDFNKEQERYELRQQILQELY